MTFATSNWVLDRRTITLQTNQTTADATLNDIASYITSESSYWTVTLNEVPASGNGRQVIIRPNNAEMQAAGYRIIMFAGNDSAGAPKHNAIQVGTTKNASSIYIAACVNATADALQNDYDVDIPAPTGVNTSTEYIPGYVFDSDPDNTSIDRIYIIESSHQLFIAKYDDSNYSQNRFCWGGVIGRTSMDATPQALLGISSPGTISASAISSETANGLINSFNRETCSVYVPEVSDWRNAHCCFNEINPNNLANFSNALNTRDLFMEMPMFMNGEEQRFLGTYHQVQVGKD